MRPSRTLEVLEALARRALTLASSAFAGNVGPHASTIAEKTLGELVRRVALNGGTMQLNDVCAFGTPTHAYPGTIAAEHLGILLLGTSFYTGVCSVWGSVGGPYGLAVIEGAQFEADPALLPGVTLTAAWGEFCVGPPQTPGIPAVAVAWDNSTNPPSLTTKRNCTWANLAAPIGAGGFNFNVQDLETGARILKEFI